MRRNALSSSFFSSERDLYHYNVKSSQKSHSQFRFLNVGKEAFPTICESRIHSGYFASTAEADVPFGRNMFMERILGRKLTPNILRNSESPTPLHSCHQTFQTGRRRVLAKCNIESSVPAVTPDSLWERLLPVISYLQLAELAKVRDALDVAFEAHDGQKRKSGEPFIIHPVEVAIILGELEMDWESVAAGLLHDTVEDTEKVTFDMIETRYGTGVRKIVEGETKVSKIGKMTNPAKLSDKKADMKANDLRQMFMAMTEEIRVIIVKLADRLHNMRTLTHMPPHKQKYISMETLDVFSRLAKLLGMYRVKSELEELSFMYAFPEEYAEIKRRMDVLSKQQEEVVLGVKQALTDLIQKDQFLASCAEETKVLTFCKEPYSIYKKMIERKCSLEDIRDISQIHIVIKLKSGDTTLSGAIPERLCYHVLGLCHLAGRPVPQRVKDYIATPKPNGYRSLHTTILPKDSSNVCFLEIQIRTEEMERMAERGVVALYNRRLSAESDSEEDSRSWWTGGAGAKENVMKVNFLNSLREWSSEIFQSMSSPEFVSLVKQDWLSKPVFVFTPKGEVKYLPKGATVVDYAYHIHTDIGNQMVAAKVNDKMVPPTHVLSNAEVVEVVTYPGPVTGKGYQRHQEWLKTVVNRSSRYKIQKFLKDNAQRFPALTGPEKPKSESSAVNESQEKSSAEEGSLVILLPTRVKNGAVRSSSPERDLPEPASRKVLPNGKSNRAAEAFSGSGFGSVRCLADFQSEAWLQGMKNADFRKAVEGFRAMEDQTMAALAFAKTLNPEGEDSSGVQWIVVDCLDRTGLLAEVSTLLSEAGLLICTHFGQTQTSLGIGVMIFAVQGRGEAELVSAVTRLESVECVLSYAVKSTGTPLEPKAAFV